nr:unnamed protein product [Callosobruchus analis]
MSDSDSPVLTSQLPKSQDQKFQLVFKNVLKQSGVILSLGEDPNILKQEQSLVVRDLEKNCCKSDASLKEFIKGLEAFCKKEKYFNKALASSVLRKNDDSFDERHLDIEQESLVRILLKTNQIQKYMIEILLNEIMAVAPEALENTQHLHLLLTPLRYLPYIINPQDLATRLLDILEIATFPSQLEILDSLPDIMPDSQYAETAKQLCKLMDDNDELTGATIDCLNALDLDAEMKAQVRDTILAKITGGTNLKIFPVLLSFLMSDCKSNNILPTLLKIRNALDMMMSSSEDSKEQESCRIVIFNKLHMYAISPKIVSESWMNMITGIRSHNDHKPIDYLLLFMLHSKAHLKKRIIELTFRKRVQSGLFKIKLLEKMFQEYLPQQLLKDYFESMVKIGCYLLRSSNDKIVIEFACTLFQAIFKHPYTEPIYRREVLEALVILTCSVEQKKIINILQLLSSFLEEKLILQQHTVLLMRLLEKLDSFSLRDLKEVFEILCSLTCGEDADDSMSGLRDEIHMIVRKQLHSTKKCIKLRGIISAVVMARHIALVSQERDVEVPKGILNIDQLPRGAARDAAAILELASASISGCPELIGLYYDQLSAMLLPNTYFEPYFLAWLHDTSTVNFNEKYLIDTVPNAVNDILFSSQYALNRTDEMYDLVQVNIGGLTLSNDTSVQLLAPHFRLLRLLNYRQQNGDLSSIDALLGSSVILPNVDDFDDLDSDQAKQVADCLFHCANWFRELVSGFVTQKSKRIRAKVAERLQDLIEMEEKLNKCLARCPEHKLPSSYFDSVHELNRTISPAKKDNKVRNPRKKLKPATRMDTMKQLLQLKLTPKASSKRRS